MVTSAQFNADFEARTQAAFAREPYEAFTAAVAAGRPERIVERLRLRAIRRREKAATYAAAARFLREWPPSPVAFGEMSGLYQFESTEFGDVIVAPDGRRVATWKL